MYNDDERKTENLGNEAASSANSEPAKNDRPNSSPSGNSTEPAGGQPGLYVAGQGISDSQPGPSVAGPSGLTGGSQPGPTGGPAGPASPQPPNEIKPNTYYEPWQQPVYRGPGQEFSPGLHSGGYNAYQRSAPTPPPPPPKKKKSGFSGFVKAVCLVLVCVLASAGATYGVLQYDRNYGDGQDVNQVVLGTAAPDDDDAEVSAQSDNTPAATGLTSSGKEMSAEDIYSMAVNQVVGVNSESKTNVFGQLTTSAVSGSGFIISKEGYIVTNYHVIDYAVNDGYTLTVMMHDGTSYPAQIVGYDQDNDVAVIKIDAPDLSVVSIGDNNDMKVGDRIYTIGNPLGELDYTMTSGIVSALDRVIQVDASTSINMFQIDAAVNSGNSGGPVYNAEGKVIGIVSAKYASTGVEGLGFAIPINDAVDIVSQLITNGYVSGKPSMGISVRDWSSAYAQYYGTPEGALVEAVAPGSAADKAGIKVGDIITKLGDTDVTSSNTLLIAKKTFSAGDTTTIIVNRDGEERSLSITFDEEGVTSTSSHTTTTQEQPVLPNRAGIAG